MISQTLSTVDGIIRSSSRSSRRQTFLLIAMCHTLFGPSPAPRRAGWGGRNLELRPVRPCSIPAHENDLSLHRITDRHRFHLKTLQHPNDVSASHESLSQ